MIESKDNEKLKLVRKLQVPKHRGRQGLFATEGEDLLAAGLAAGATPRFVLVAGGTGLHGTDAGSGAAYPVEVVHSDLLDSVSALGSGTRRDRRLGEEARGDRSGRSLRLPRRGRR